MVLGLSILHLLEDYAAAIDKAFAWLKPGGVFVSNTACIGDSMPLFGLVAPLGRWFGVFPYVNIFTESDLFKREDLQPVFSFRIRGGVPKPRTCVSCIRSTIRSRSSMSGASPTASRSSGSTTSACCVSSLPSGAALY